MIELINVTKYYQTDIGRHYVLRDISLKIPRNINLAIIGANGAGKSTMLRLIAGVDIPNSGKIVRTGRISWPMGLTPGIQQVLNGYENARFACRIYGMTNEEIHQTIEKVRDIAGIGKYFDLPVYTYSAGMRQRLSFAISISLEFDYYLFDEVGAGGDRAFKKLANELIEKRLSKSNFIMVSHAPSDILDLCHAAVLLRDGAVMWFDDVRTALVEYGETDFLAKVDRRTRKKKRKKAAAERRANSAANSADGVESDISHGRGSRRRQSRRTKRRTKRRLTRVRQEARTQRLESLALPVAELTYPASSSLTPQDSSGSPNDLVLSSLRTPARGRNIAKRSARQRKTGATPQAEPLVTPITPMASALEKRKAASKRKIQRRLSRNKDQSNPADRPDLGAVRPPLSQQASRSRKETRLKRRAIRHSRIGVGQIVGNSNSVGTAPTKPAAGPAATKIHALAEDWAARKKTSGQNAGSPAKPGPGK